MTALAGVPTLGDTAPTNHERLLAWVTEVADLTLPDRIEWCTGSREEWDRLTNELVDAMNIWARFIYGPLLDDRERTIAEGTTPGQYGRKEAFTVHKVLREKGPVTVPREFVFMDRAAIGLGGVFLHLDAKQNWYRLFNETIEGFDLETVAARQKAAFEAAGVPLPV